MSKFSKRAKFLSILAAASAVGKTGAGATTIPDYKYIPPSVEAQNAAKLEKDPVVNANINNLNVKPEEKKSFFGKIGSYMYHHPFKTIGWGILGAVGTDVTVRTVNEYVRLPIIYKQLDQEFETGLNSSSVKEYEYRFKDEKGNTKKTLIVKAIGRFSMGSTDFESEKLAMKELKKINNPHLAKIFDCHRGIMHLYVVSEKVGNSNWKQYWQQKMQNEKWDEKQKFEWLKDVCNQIVDVALDLYNKGFYHGDPNIGNFNILDVGGKPFVKFFDFGRFYKKKDNYEVLTPFSQDQIKNPTNDLRCIRGSVMRLFARFLLDEDIHLSNDENLKLQSAIQKHQYVRDMKELGLEEELTNKLLEMNGNDNALCQMYKFIGELTNNKDILGNEEFKEKLENFKTKLNEFDSGQLKDGATKKFKEQFKEEEKKQSSEYLKENLKELEKQNLEWQKRIEELEK